MCNFNSHSSSPLCCKKDEHQPKLQTDAKVKHKLHMGLATVVSKVSQTNVQPVDPLIKDLSV
jgi:hypothetical protein